MSHIIRPPMTIEELKAFMETKPDTRQLINETINTLGTAGLLSYLSSQLNTYENNEEAVAALGSGKLYKSPLLNNDSQIVLVTV